MICEALSRSDILFFEVRVRESGSWGRGRPMLQKIRSGHFHPGLEKASALPFLLCSRCPAQLLHLKFFYHNLH